MQTAESNRHPLKVGAFAITARIAMQLGRESISSSVVAVLELVKNSYDADAETVVVKFQFDDEGDLALVIEDDGSGMSEQQVSNNWFMIGTDSKLVTQRSGRKSRVMTGEKGLGRLGLDRLCERSILQTFTNGSTDFLEVEIDWRKYEGTNAKLDSIEHQIYLIERRNLPTDSLLAERNSGTRLVLMKLKDTWLDETKIRLENELSLLVTPFGGVNDFAIYFSRLGNKTNRISSENLLEAAEWKIISTLEQNKDKRWLVTHSMISKQFNAEYHSPQILDTEQTSSNRVVSTAGGGFWNEVFKDGNSPVPKCGPTRLEFYYIPREDVPALSLKRGQINQFMDSNQGIRIYRDNFRVMPYGKPNGEGDWLGLGIRRTSSPGSVRGAMGGWRVGYNQIVGAVFIGRETNPDLLDQTNREGIVEGPAFYDLRRFTDSAIRFFELRRQQYEKDKAPKDTTKLTKAFQDAEKTNQLSIQAIGELRNSLNRTFDLANQEGFTLPAEFNAELKQLGANIEQIDKVVNEQKRVQERLLQATEERDEEFQQQKDTLGNLASLGILAAAFGHETEGASNLVLENSNQLRTNIGKLILVQPDVLQSIDENLDAILYGASKVNSFAKFTLKNVSRDKRKRKLIKIEQVVHRVFEGFSSILEKDRKIKVEFEFADNLPSIHAFAIDWESIVVNFITNAVWALEDIPAEKRQIKLRIYSDTTFLHFWFADSGKGIAAELGKDIFLPTISSKRNLKGEVIGTGMGLAIVKGFVEAYDGTIEVVSPSTLGGAEFHITVPFSRSQKEE